MAKTLVIKLGETVNNDNLTTLGELRFGVSELASANGETNAIRFGNEESVKLTIIGDGYFTDSTLAVNNGKTLKLPIGEDNKVFFSNGNYTVSVISKYSLSRIAFPFYNNTISHNNFAFELSSFKGMTALKNISLLNNALRVGGDISSLSELTKLDNLSIVGANQVTGDISVLIGASKIRIIMLSKSQVTGDISVLKDMKELAVLDLSYTGCTGDTSSIASLHPNNGGKLATFTYEGTSITGSWPPA